MTRDLHATHGHTLEAAAVREAHAERRTIDLTPTWSGILPALLLIIARADGPTAYNTAMDELRRMARLADRYVAEHGKDAE